MQKVTSLQIIDGKNFKSLEFLSKFYNFWLSRWFARSHEDVITIGAVSRGRGITDVTTCNDGNKSSKD